MHLFIHGGYWRRFSARDHDFVAPALVEAGLATFVVNYELCPTVTLDEIVRQVRAAIAWAFGHGAEFGADPSRLTISGHSAGGHLVAMALETDWARRLRPARDLIKGAVAISGLFDLGFVAVQLRPAQGPGDLGPGAATEPDAPSATHGTAVAGRRGRRRDRRVPPPIA